MKNIQWNSYVCGPQSSPPLLLLHGFLGCSRDWQKVAEELTPHFSCWCPDLPGHGETQCAPETPLPEMPALAAALLAEMDRRGLARCACIGYSMGGRLALYLATHYPQRFWAVVVESASPGLPSASARHTRQEQDEALASRLAEMEADPEAFAAFLEEWYAMPLFKSLTSHPETLKNLLRRRRINRPAVLAAALRALGTGSQPNLWPMLGDISVPTLLVTGALDLKYVALSKEMQKHAPQLHTYCVPDCGHNVHLENPKSYTTVIKRFLLAHYT